jgi:aspartate-semialdehyde dehydrogenase
VDGFRVGVLGATGVVGREFLKILAERQFPVSSLRLLATARSAGRVVEFGGREWTVEETTRSSFENLDFVFISASGDASREYAPIAAEAGAIVIDDSSAWRLDEKVPLVVPEVNPGDLAWHERIISTPNCSTVPLVMAIEPLRRVNPVKRVIADTYQSVSGTGTAAVEELRSQTARLMAQEPAEAHVYPHQIAFNLLPEIDRFLESGYTREEWKMMMESRKILHDDALPLSATCVRVPVYVSHSEAVHLDLERPMDPGDVREILANAPGVAVLDDPTVSLYPTPWQAAGRDEVFVGRIRQDASNPNGIAMWLVSDNLRKGAALNVVQVMEELVARKLV